MLPYEEKEEVIAFIYLEARLADEARYDEWEALWTDEANYWVPRMDGLDPATQVSHINDNRARIATRIAQLKTGYRYSQEPASPMRRLVSNIEIESTDNGYRVASNFLLLELAVQSTSDMHFWGGRVTHELARVGSELKMSRKKVVLVNGDEPIPNLAFLI